MRLRKRSTIFAGKPVRGALEQTRPGRLHRLPRYSLYRNQTPARRIKLLRDGLPTLCLLSLFGCTARAIHRNAAQKGMIRSRIQRALRSRDRIVPERQAAAELLRGNELVAIALDAVDGGLEISAVEVGMKKERRDRVAHHQKSSRRFDDPVGLGVFAIYVAEVLRNDRLPES